MQVVVDGLITRYTLAGQGKTVLLLHGWADTLAGFHDLAAGLETNYQIVALDLPGFGQTQTPENVWGLDDYAKFVQAFLTKLKIKPYAIIGHSNGGAIALRAIGSNTINCNKLVLLASAGVRGEYKGRIKAARLLTKTGKVLVSPLPKSLKNKLRRQVYHTVGSDMLVAEHLQETFKKIVTDDVREDAAKVTTQTLMIYGNNDESTPPSYGEQFNKLIKGSALEMIESAGHFVHRDQPEQVKKLIKDFLK